MNNEDYENFFRNVELETIILYLTVQPEEKIRDLFPAVLQSRRQDLIRVVQELFPILKNEK